MTLRFIYLLLLLCLLLLTCDHGYAAKDLKEKHSSANFHKNCDEAEEKTSKSSYITRLESKYDSGYIAAYEADEKIARLGSKYDSSYQADEKIPRLESKYDSGYAAAHEADEKIARLENKYDSGYIAAYEADGKTTRLEGKSDDHGHDHGHDDDIGSEDVGVFTVDDVRAFDVGRKLSTFFSIRNRSLYPGFLPREVADFIPFSTVDIPKILQFFSVSPDSPKGKAIKKTISTCEVEPAKGEIKICATSSESMFEFLKTAFGESDFKLISTSHPTMTTPILQSYTVLEPPREIESQRKVACHPLPYLYGIYMCHYDATETKIFKVLLVGDNGDKVDALIVCHMDTSAWSPKHSAFSLLGTKPGIPVCHSFSEGHGVWL